MKPALILLSGKKFTGKDTVADYLINYNGYTRVAFADQLKWMCYKLMKDTFQCDCHIYESTFERSNFIFNFWNIICYNILQIITLSV